MMKERQGQRRMTFKEMFILPLPLTLNPNPGLLLGLGLGLLRVTYFEVLIFVECACENGRNVIQWGVDGLLKDKDEDQSSATKRQG
jgi:hypothetical protein